MTSHIVQKSYPEQFCEEVNKWANKGYIFRPETFTAGFSELYGVVEKPDPIDGMPPPEPTYITCVVSDHMGKLNQECSELRIIAIAEFELKLVAIIQKAA